MSKGKRNNTNKCCHFYQSMLFPKALRCKLWCNLSEDKYVDIPYIYSHNMTINQRLFLELLMPILMTVFNVLNMWFQAPFGCFPKTHDIVFIQFRQICNLFRSPCQSVQGYYGGKHLNIFKSIPISYCFLCKLNI